MKKLFFLLTFSLLIHYSFGQLPSIRNSEVIVLKGTIVTPEEIIPAGLLFIQNNKISGIYHSAGKIAIPRNAVYIDTKGLIFPGFVDLHNHVSWNVFPRWEHPGTKFNNRFDWRKHSQDFQSEIKIPYDNLQGDFFCLMNTYGELRSLIGGTTSILNTSTADECIDGLVRNLDDASQVQNRHIKAMIDITNQKPNQSDTEFQNQLNEVKEKLTTGDIDALIIHLAEGKSSDLPSKWEFQLLVNVGLLTEKTVIVHGTAIGQAEFNAMKSAGSSLVWSPRSNIDLYGQTTDIVKARSLGINIALAPDWAISGSKNMLDELNFVSRWIKTHGISLTDKDLFEMSTSIPAAISGIADKVGSIKVGLYADLLVISGDSVHPYSSLVKAQPDQIRLVFVNGSPLYGNKELMKKFWNLSDLEELGGGLNPMVLKLPLPKSTLNSFKELAEKLSEKMKDQGTTLAPLFTPTTGFIKPGIDKKTKPPVIRQY
jgi:5-methylthioadenosine/S-adenosylhomocysteine deaminase